MDKIEELRICVQKITKEATKFFEKNIKTSGVRTRKKLQKCKKIAQEIRMLIQKKKKEHIQKKAAVAAAAAAVSAGHILLGKGLNVTNDLILIHKNNDLVNIDINSNHLYKNPNSRFRLLNLERFDNFFFLSKRIKKKTENSFIKKIHYNKKLAEVPRWY